VRNAIHALKYKRRRDAAVPLAALLSARLAKGDIPFDLMTSVPLHPARERERGYNQAELLAEQTARQTRSIYVRACQRTRATADQVGLDPAARRLNVQAAFAPTSTELRGQRVLLIDDVCTTGATLDACAGALYAGGARAVYGLTVARAR
jgi:ComF family protein